MQIRGIIFDFNGTMFFDTEKQEETWRKMLKEVTGRDVTDRELKEHMHGRRNKDIFEYFLGKPLTEEEADRLVSRKEAMYRAMCVEDLAHFCFVDGLTELLDELKACGIQRTIATGSEQENVDFFEEYLHLHNRIFTKLPRKKSAFRLRNASWSKIRFPAFFLLKLHMPQR